MTNYDKLLELSKVTGDNIAKLNSSHRFDGINQCIIFAEDLNKWINYCDGFEKVVLVKEAQDECIKSIFMCAQGLYKEAIITLRQFLEHILFATLLSASDYNYRLWRIGEYDMSWANIMDSQHGVFSKNFIKLYGKELNEERSIELITIAKNVYRECSEFVHGNYKTIINSSSRIEYNEIIQNKYLEYFSSIKYIVSMALLIRFREVLDNRNNLKDLEAIILDYIGDIYEVQCLYCGEDDF